MRSLFVGVKSACLDPKKIHSDSVFIRIIYKPILTSCLTSRIGESGNELEVYTFEGRNTT
ncbi:hypothetical protein GXM_07917 [Nostoc sphaeroides CCNUC1]|uniref:Uncharacterized protein n=1 Tax=Nostoc sphaeroides CCNUC1 TaxID=2653204 RepID=A0A5P8WC83_9NOSO|nr:hypothetical protein GXM_07917 [Nostoc sphaeroides CCNUC1]